MRFSVLSSSSRANATFVESAGTRILIDCGLSATQTENRLERLGVSAKSLKAIIVTHEHSDHIKGLSLFSRRHKIPVYANAATASCISNVYGIEIFKNHLPFSIAQLKIEPFEISHDALDPVGFRISSSGLVLTQVTDLGVVTSQVERAVRGANALIIESNHDPEMLTNCRYSWPLKQRIASERGHLSNESAANVIAKALHPELFHIVLGHISENSNTPDIALKTLKQHVDLSSLHSVLCGSRLHATPMHQIGERFFRQVL